MKSELKAKFLNHLLSKKKDQGFTLIELLVVIIIIGILSAIALPSFLNQANKGKQSEAKTYVGTLNRTQQAYFLEKGKFAASLDEMSKPVAAATENYTYSSAPPDKVTDKVLSLGTSKGAALRSYGGTVFLEVDSASGEANTNGILCENTKPGTTAVAIAESATKCGKDSSQVK
ncbi:type IV pilin-like G/H family protein [Leptolyngbya sp. AN10]|uniref:type IV pilin-like G/H family protein n=1 Tax=Leptolyngbya sp. AN10 TaxID=3423365 RepID=UPI003D31DED8